MSQQKKNIITNIFQYASAQYISQFIGFFTAFLTRIFLGPFFTGLWNLLSVVVDYAGYANLGTTSTVFYQLPMLKGSGENEKAERLSNAIFNFITIGTFVCSIGVVIYAVIFKNKLSTEMFIGLLVVSILLLTQRVYTYYIILMRANKDFTILSKSIIFDAFINVALTILIVGKFKLYGFYFVSVIMPVLNVIFIRRYITYNLKFGFYLKGIISYIRYGFPLFVMDILNQVLNSIDKIMIASFLGLEPLGFYSLALMARSYSAGMSKNFTIVITPYFLGDFNKRDIASSSKYIITCSHITSYFMSILLSVVYIAAPALVFYVLPKFLPGIMSLKIYLLTTFFFTVLTYNNHYVVALGKQARLIPIVCISIGINIALNFIFLKHHQGINGVAWATAISSFASFLMISVYALRHSENLRNIMKFFVEILFPLAYCFALVIILEKTVFYKNLIIETIVHLVLFCILACPLIFYLNKKTGIARLIWQTLLEKIHAKQNR